MAAIASFELSGALQSRAIASPLHFIYKSEAVVAVNVTLCNGNTVQF